MRPVPAAHTYIRCHNLLGVFFFFSFRLWAKYCKASNGSMLNYMEFLEELGVTKFTLQEGTILSP